MQKSISLIGLIIAGLLVMACGDGAAVFPNKDGIPNNCEYTAGAHYQQNHFARFDNNNNRLLLVDWSNGETLFVMDTNIAAARTTVLEWSPNCQYLITHQDGTGIIYDVVNGRRLVAFAQMRGYHRSNPSAVFDQSNTYLTVEAGGTTYLHNLLTGETFPLAAEYFTLQYFDLARTQLVTISDSEAAIYDMNTGMKLTSLGDLDLGGRPRMIFSPDNTTLAFTSDNRWTHIINRDTLARVDVSIGYYTFGRESTMALSPDNRWLAIGAERVNVWDLQNLQPINGERMPTTFNFPGPEGLISDIHFVNGETLEAVTGRGTTYWNMTTGDQVNP